MEAKPDKPDGKEWDGTSIVLCFIFILFAILFIVLGLFIYERFVSFSNIYAWVENHNMVNSAIH